MITEFSKRINSVFAGMRYRCAEKRFKAGKNKGMIRRHATPIPFSARELEAHLLKVYGEPGKPFQCKYCTAWITLMVAVYDHAIPLGKGGGAGLDNIDAICSDCNDVKGQMLPESFVKLLDFLRDLGVRYPKCAQDVHNRLARATAATKEGNRLRFRLNEVTSRAAAREVDQVEDDF